MNDKGAAKHLRRAVLLLIVLLALALLVFVLLRAFGRAAETSTVELPQSRTDDTDTVTPVPFMPQTADVTPETVKAVLHTISPVRSYSRALLVETYWEGGGTTEVILTWVRDDSLRLRSDARNLLATPDGLWLWYDDADAVFSANATAERDRYMRILDWETLLDGETEIVAAAYTEFEGERCIYAASRGGAFDYVTEIYVSLRSGLLIAADTYEGEKCVYRMRSGSLEITTPDESWFIPPEGGA